MIAKIVSGGQTGADIGALDAAIRCQVPHGGWCPKGRRQELGRTVSRRYQLREMHSPLFSRRTEANVVDSDATLILTFGSLTGGSLRTRGFAEKHGKPCLHLDVEGVERVEVVERVEGWLRRHFTDNMRITLNVAGNRESGAPGLQRVVMLHVTDILIAVNNLPAEILLAGNTAYF